MNFYISAAHKSSGKTTISIGLSAALAETNTVQTFKKGPDYIDPIWLKQASHNPCFNLDFYTMSADEITDKFNQYSSDFRLIEGNKGLYDGLNKNGTDSNAALANLLKIPVILVVDCTGITRGIAPLLLGYQQFNKPSVNISGVILNKIGGARHESKLITAIDYYTNIPVIGAVHKNPAINIDERHLGLIPSNELTETESLIKKIKTVIQSSIDLNFFKPSPPSKKISTIQLKKQFNLKIAVAKDAAFGFYYDDDLQTFENLGATVVYFSPLNDKKLPDNIDGLFLGGGFPETSALKLSQNQKMLNDLRQKINNGLPAYAECGGLMILTNQIINQNQQYPMAKIINADCVMHKKPQGRGYVNIIPTEQHLWNMPKNLIKAHEFHYSALENIQDKNFVYKISRGTGIINKKDGIFIHNLLANYVHLKNTKQSPWIKYFLKFCQSNKTG